ncbi:MAG: hypothetical protein KF861_15900 [Planctomycetaceae bacterium]|nr:hypothetical protein [Planctomycetaceae bacterium]
MRRRTGQTAALRVATAAIVVLALIGVIAMLTQTGSSHAFAQVAGRVNATRTLRAVVVDPREGGTLLVSGTRTRFEGVHTVIISDSAILQEVMLDGKVQLAYRIPHRGVSRAFDFYGVFRALAAAASSPIEDQVDKGGRRLFGLRGHAELKIGPETTWKVDAKVWSDPATKLPVRLEIRSADADGREFVTLIDEIEFDVALNDALFDMTIPPGFTVVGLSADQLKSGSSEEEVSKLTIVPGDGIGPVKFGMSREQIVALLGDPEFTLHESYLCYPSKGLQLVLAGREPDMLGMIIVNPSDAASLTRNDFHGRTDKGIRMGSSKQEVRDAYGEPDAPLPSDRGSRADVFRYEKLGVMFVFLDSKVQQIILNR